MTAPVIGCTHPYEELRTWVLEGTKAAAIVYCTRCHAVLVVDMREALIRREAERDGDRAMTAPTNRPDMPYAPQEVSIPLSYLDELEGVYRQEYGELGLQRCAQRNGMRGAITGYDWGYLAIAAREEPDV